MALPSVTDFGSAACIIANYVGYDEVMRPGESGNLVAVYVKNVCPEPADLILRLVTLDDETANDSDLPKRLEPGEGQILYGFRTFVPKNYEEKYLPFYVEFYQNTGGGYAFIGALPALNTTVFPDFSVALSVDNTTVRAGGKLLMSIKPSKEATSSIYNVTAYFVSGSKKVRVQIIEADLDPDGERRVYLDIPGSMVLGTYDLRPEVWKRKYKLAESDPLGAWDHGATR